MNNRYPWEDYPEIWSTEAAFMTFIRGGIRRGLWEKHPVKLKFLNDNRVRLPLGKPTKKEPEGKTVYCHTCSQCKESFPSSKGFIQVDHIKGHHSLKKKEDIQKFIEAMVYVREEDLQLICKNCHNIKSYAEKMNITFEEATLEKEVIAFGKLKAREQKQMLEDIGLLLGSNGEERKDIYREYLRNGV